MPNLGKGMPGRVVHVKREAYDVYVGRPSRWGNPFSHKPGTKARYRVADRTEAIASYRRWLWEEIRAGRVQLEELAALDGKTLGCWCSPAPCHGEVLLEAAAWAARQLEQERSRGRDLPTGADKPRG